MGVMSTFDSLPDAVSCLILSKLRNAQTVAQCATVCRKWRLLSQWVDILTFESFKLFEKRVDKASKASCLEEIVSKMVFKSNGVRELNISYHPVVWPWIPDDHFSEDKVCLWLQHVCGTLEKLVLIDPNRANPQPEKLLCLSDCPKLRYLNLCYGMIPEMPCNLKQFECLRTCIFDLLAISDKALESFVALCPLLEDLKVNSCKGLRTPNLTIPNLTSLEFLNEMDMGETAITCLRVDAPKLTKVSLSYVQEFITDGCALQDIALLCNVNPVIQDLPCLTSLYMKGEVWVLESILKLVRLVTSIRKLYVDTVISDKNSIQLACFFQQMQLLESLYIGLDLFECFQAGSILVSMDQVMVLPKLEEITAVVRYGNKSCVYVLSTLLICSPSLRTLRINAEPLKKNMGNVMFFTDVLRLQREFPSVHIVLDCPYSLV